MDIIQDDRDVAEETYVYKLYFLIEILDHVAEAIFKAIVNYKPDRNTDMSPKLQALHQVLKTLEIKKLQVKEEISIQKMECLETIPIHNFMTLNTTKVAEHLLMVTSMENVSPFFL